jgi:hypothetical protein
VLIGEMNECIVYFTMGGGEAKNSILEWIVGVFDDLIGNALNIADESRLLLKIWFIFLCL